MLNFVPKVGGNTIRGSFYAAGASQGMVGTNYTRALQTAGLSLLTAKMTVYNSAGIAVASTSAADPLNNNLSITINSPQLLGTYYVKIESATSYGPSFFLSEFGNPCQCRSFSGDGTSDGTPVTYTAEVCDEGEPGNSPNGTDRFRIELSDGYTAIGNPIVGGNIQLHKPCLPCEESPREEIADENPAEQSNAISNQLSVFPR